MSNDSSAYAANLRNMTNAVYMTEYLPLKTKDAPTTDFESAICEYFAFYSPSRTGELVTKLKQYDFTSVKAHFIASVPGKFEGEKANKWGIGRLKRLLKNVESHPHTQLFGQVNFLPYNVLIIVFICRVVWEDRYLAWSDIP
jgi:Tyrosyl-DNA phosphodiesterase